MKLKMDIAPVLLARPHAEIASREKVVSAPMREAGGSLKSARRSQITGADLGIRLSILIWLATLSLDEESLNTAARV